MITIFNRKELLCTFAMEVQANVRYTLSQNGIDYVVSTSDSSLRSRSAGRLASAGDVTCEYHIYVKKKDYESAAAVLKGRL